MSQFSVLLLLCFYRCRLELWVTGTGAFVRGLTRARSASVSVVIFCLLARGRTRCWCLASNCRRDIWLLSHDTADNVRPLPFFSFVYGTTKAWRVANGGGGKSVCEVTVCSFCDDVCVFVWRCLSASVPPPRPQRLALHLSSINHRESLLSHSVAIVSGPETVLGCLAGYSEE